ANQKKILLDNNFKSINIYNKYNFIDVLEKYIDSVKVQIILVNVMQDIYNCGFKHDLKCITIFINLFNTNDIYSQECIHEHMDSDIKKNKCFPLLENNINDYENTRTIKERCDKYLTRSNEDNNIKFTILKYDCEDCKKLYLYVDKLFNFY